MNLLLLDRSEYKKLFNNLGVDLTVGKGMGSQGREVKEARTRGIPKQVSSVGSLGSARWWPLGGHVAKAAELSSTTFHQLQPVLRCFQGH